MNLNIREINERMKGIKENINALGASVTLLPEVIYENRQHIFWYTGKLWEIKYKEFTIIVKIGGSNNCDLYKDNQLLQKIRGKNNTALYENIGQYIKNDKELEELLKTSNSLKLKKMKPEGLHLDVIRKNRIDYIVFDNETETYVNLFVDISREDDILDCFINVKSFILAIDEYVLVKNQSRKIVEMLGNNSVLVCKKVNDEIRCVDIKRNSSKPFYVQFKIYDGFYKFVDNRKDVISLNRYFSYLCPSEKKFISECSSLVPIVTNYIKITTDSIEKEIKDFMDSNKNIIIIGYCD